MCPGSNATRIPVWELVVGLSNAADLVDPALHGHHRRVAFIAGRLADELGLPPEDRRDVVLAGLLHDMGALYLRDRLRLMDFECDFRSSDSSLHAEAGFRLLEGFGPFERSARIVRYHHILWNHGRGESRDGEAIPQESHLLHLADRAAVLMGTGGEVLTRTADIRRRIGSAGARWFDPRHVEAFQSAAASESFWLEACDPAPDLPAMEARWGRTTRLDGDNLLDLARLFCQIIDFRSPFTASHTSGVAAVADALYSFMGMPATECRRMAAAGYLHDVGKLSVPTEILEKPAPLTRGEFGIIRGHSFATHRVLSPIRSLDTVARWASCHHERLDGKGYPFHYRGNELSTGCRVMAVADVFTALTEDRPYRKGMTPDSTLRLLRALSRNGALDGEVVDVVASRYGGMNAIRTAAQSKAVTSYRAFATPVPAPN